MCSKNLQRIGKGTGKLGNKKTSGDYRNYSLIQIDQNTEKILGDLRRLAVTQTPVENRRLTLERKTFKGVMMIMTVVYEAELKQWLTQNKVLQLLTPECYLN